MLTTLSTSHFEMSPSNDLALRNMLGMFVTLGTSHFERSLLNPFAPRNIPDMSLTFDTSHFEMSPRNNFASENMLLISATLDTPHCPIGPRGPLEQPPFGNRFRHALTALLRSALDRGKNATVTCVCLFVCLFVCLIDCLFVLTASLCEVGVAAQDSDLLEVL